MVTRWGGNLSSFELVVKGSDAISQFGRLPLEIRFFSVPSRKSPQKDTAPASRSPCPKIICSFAGCGKRPKTTCCRPRGPRNVSTCLHELIEPRPRGSRPAGAFFRTLLAARSLTATCTPGASQRYSGLMDTWLRPPHAASANRQRLRITSPPRTKTQDAPPIAVRAGALRPSTPRMG
jgi:hypothetical protein